MHEKKADRHNSKRTILLSFFNSAYPYIVLLYTNYVWTQSIDSICF